MAQASLAAMNNEQYLLAGSRIGKGGKLELDMDAYRRAQGMSFADVQRTAADKLREMQAHGIFDWNTRKQELKDQIAQGLRPGEMQINMLRQARAFQAGVPGMTLGTAIEKTTGMSADQARSIEVAATSRAYWDGLIQQMQAQRHDVVSRARARFTQDRPLGAWAATKQDFREGLGDISDTVSMPYRRISEHLDRVREDEDAAKYGEHIRRVSDSAIAHDDAERKMINVDDSFLRSYRRGTGGPRAFAPNIDVGGGNMFGLGTTRNINRITSYMGLSSTSDANRASSLADESYGAAFDWHPLSSFHDARASMARLESVAGAARMAGVAETMTGKDQIAVAARLSAGGGGSGGGRLQKATEKLFDRIRGMRGGSTGIPGVPLAKAGWSATALSARDVRQSYIDSQEDKAKAALEFDKDPSIGASMLKSVMDNGTAADRDVVHKSQDIGVKFGAIDKSLSREGLQKDVQEELERAGIGDFSDAAKSTLGALMAHHTDEEMAVASAVYTAAHGETADKRARASKQLEALRTKEGEKKMDELTATAGDINKGLSAKGAQVMLRLSGQENQGAEGLLGGLANARDSLSKEKTGAAFDAMEDQITKWGGTQQASIVESLKTIPEEKLKAMEDSGDKATADLIRAGRSGDKGALTKLGQKYAVAQKATAVGGETSVTSELDKSIAAAQTMRDQTATDTPEGQASAGLLDASTTFAKAVDTFGDIIDKFRGSSETASHNWMNPIKNPQD
ncbi:MAG: hypothetical protein WAN65_30370 [Candidatus Sulfotelmatobacter sp.]